MIKFRFAVVCVLMVFAVSALFAQDTPPKKGIEHRTRKAGGTKMSSTLGDGSVHLEDKAGGTQSSGAGAGKITKTSSSLGAGNTRSIHGGWDQNKSGNLDASAFKGSGKSGARLKSRHPGGAN
jgi:hypothetical protein